MRQRGPSPPAVVPAPSAHHVGRTGSGIRRPNPTGGAVANSYGDRPAWSDGRLLFLALTGLVITMGAVTLEVVSSSYANSSVPGWAEWVPLAWPQALRVLWWLVVAASAGVFRWTLGRLGLHPNRLVTALTVAPFVAFAMGIAVGADWATWH